MKLNFVGILQKTKKHELEDTGTGEWRGKKCQVILDCGDFGKHYMTLFGGDFKDTKRVNGKPELVFRDKKMNIGKNKQDQEEITIKYEERFNSEIINRLPNYRKKSLTVKGADTVEYIFDTDFVEDIYNGIAALEGKRFEVFGDFFVNPNVEKGINYKEFRISDMREVEDDVPQKAELLGKLIYTAEPIDPSFFNGGNLSSETIKQYEGKIPLKTYMEMPVQDKILKKTNPTCLIPVDTKIDTSGINFNDQDDVDLLTTMATLFNSVPTGKCMEWNFICDIYNKQEMVELSEEDIEAVLTPQEKMIALLAKKHMAKRGLGGEKKFDLDKVALKKQKKQMYGDRIQDICLVVPNGMPEESTSFSTDMLELYKVLFKAKPKTKETKKAAPKQKTDVERLSQATTPKPVATPTPVTPTPVVEEKDVQETVIEPKEPAKVEEAQAPNIADKAAFQALFGAKK